MDTGKVLQIDRIYGGYPGVITLVTVQSATLVYSKHFTGKHKGHGTFYYSHKCL